MNLRRFALLALLPIVLGGCGSEEGRALCAAVQEGDLEAVQALIVEGADVNENVRFQGSMTRPLRLALLNTRLLSERRDAIAIAVIEAGGDPNLSWSFGGGDGSPGKTMYAVAEVARAGRTSVIEALLRAGARIEGAEQGGEALLAAARGNHIDVLGLLIEAGADVNYKSRSGATPLEAAVDGDADEAILLLEERGAREW